jgi:hypothetical protein
MSLRLLIWWPRGSSLTWVPGWEARACSDDVLGSVVLSYMPQFPLEADLGLPEEVCPSAFGAVGLPSGSAKELRKVASNTRYGVNHETTSHDTESVTCLREMRTLEGRLGRSTLIKFG